MSRESKKVTIQFDQLTLWKTGTIVFAVLFIISILTGGFKGSGDSDVRIPSPTAPIAPSAPIAPGPQVKADVDIKDEPMMGDKNAPVTIVECSDYQCPFCNRAFTDTLPTIKKNYVDTGKVRYVFKDLPLPFHQQADEAAVAANCAGEQNKYWEMHDKLFANQGTWSGNTEPNTVFKTYAAELGLNEQKFDTCISSDKSKAEVQEDLQECNAAGATGTPTFFINGVKLVGAQPISQFTTLIDAELNT